jgi:predicted nuclease of predicted toxin-antitoxin system
LRLLADENFPGHAVHALREAGHDVAWIRQDAPGMSDVDVLGRARREGRILMTFDKDFGEMAFRTKLDQPPGVILFRIRVGPRELFAGKILGVLARAVEWEGNFVVVEDFRVRVVPLSR